ncbi:hypothetical protein AB0L74_34480 [Streptomyces sp. NPDC052020]|uniref:hypothetical protein n=1 Tax=Streptomyces sp. NPDC052020 TaxID=3155677 RepID=UPI00341BA131
MTNSSSSAQSGLATPDSEPATTPDLVDGPAAPPAPEAPAPDTEGAKTAETEVSTPGGLPVVPAVTVGTSSSIAAVSATGLAAGGPAALLTAGALVLVPMVAVAARAAAAGTSRRGPARMPGAGAQRSGGVPPQRSATRSLGTFGARRGGAGPGSGSGGGGARRGGGMGARALQHAAAVRQARRASAADAARKGRTAAAADTTRARRQLADARRAERQQRRRSPAPAPGARAGATQGRVRLSKDAPKSGGTRPQTGRGGAQSGTAGRGGMAGRLWRAGRGAATQTLARARRRSTGETGTTPKDKSQAQGGSQGRPRGFRAARRAAYRAARDRIRDRWRAEKRARIEKRARTRALRTALRRSAARHHGRRVLAALVATPLGALSLALWPVAKLLRIQPPRWGRKVLHKLRKAAQEERLARDIAAYQEHDQDEAERARQQRPRPGDVDWPRHAGAAEPTTQTKEYEMTGFDFRSVAEDMLTQAQNAEPGGMMQVLAHIETLPEAMAAIAETFATVAATCSPENMPLAPEVTDALADLHKQLVGCVDAAEAVGQLFHTHHEADIARHTDGRTAEEMWDVSRQTED